ncbi:hypothetical protein HNP84_001953 [Thermocatellispora tengchongensis]|uniref:Peptidase n=1 Tax=Thermocatellispora tengchongensis TaxID=1073253 RepID=A0A840P4T6_9ACTN|nr:hypothetical protein [Thermocatellispora tengchongensis]MBB5132237.1 hypothetical protein [Thermocatellispora tengchongensis]
MRPRPLILAAVAATSIALVPPPAGAARSTNVVEYSCTAEGVAQPQSIKVTVELTMPTDAQVGQQLTIEWLGTYAEGTALTAPPAGLPAGTKAYAYVGISGYQGLTSATGVGPESTAAIEAGETVPLPQGVVELKTTANSAGSGSVLPGALNFGTTPTEPLVECEVANRDALTPDTLTVPGTGGSTSPSATPSATTTTGTPTPSATSPRPTRTVTETATAPVPGDDGGVDRTPTGGAATGAGGEAGPDARLVVLAGLLVTFAAGAGLLLRRRSVGRTRA